MPPKKLYWPQTKRDFDLLVAQECDKYLPLIRNLQLHQLEGLSQALVVGFEEIREAARLEDIARGFRPPGTSVGQR